MRLTSLRRSLAAFCLLLGAASALQAATYTTYAAWSDAGANQQGLMYIYTGNYASTTVNLYNATAPNVTMGALYCGFPVAGVGPYQPLAEVASCPLPATQGFGNNYFMCQSDNPIVWEVEEPIYSSEADSHDFLAAADTNKYIGSVFMTYMRGDKTPGGTSGISAPSRLASDYGDQAAIINTGGTPITVKVRKWAGVPPAGAWGAVLITSPVIPPLGIWMYGPSDTGTHDRGGTLMADQGHYRFDITGGQGLLYKGNTFSPYAAPGNRDNMIHFGPDINSATKVGTDLLGAVVTDGGAPHIVINNQGAAAANYQILKFNPTTPGYLCTGCGIAGGNEYVWPINGNDPSGSWTVVSSGSIPSLSSAYYNAGALTNAGFYRVQSTNGQPLTAEFGSAILQQTWCDGDYMFATDTRLAFGRNFNFGGRFFNANQAADPVQLHIVAPFANTTVHVWVNGSVSGPNFYNSTQSTTVPNAGLAFPFSPPSGSLETWDAHITSDKVVYAYVMSTTDSGTKGGETFFSVPPPINPLVIAQKSVNKSVASPGDIVTYTLVAQNLSTNNSTNTMIWDTLPAGVAFVSSVPPPSLSLAPLYSWNLGTVAPNASATVLMAAIINSGTQLEVKHNTATASADLTQPFASNDAPVTILIPGANLTKSVSKAQAMPGDTLTYILTYTNTQPPLPNTPKLDLTASTGSYGSGQYLTNFNVTNYSGGSININDLMICYWLYDDAPPASLQFANDYGGGTAPWAWGGPTVVGTATAWSPPQMLPSNRKANLQVCIHATSGQILADGQSWTGIQPRWYVNYPETLDNATSEYSQDPVGTAVEDHHFALYYQGKLVTEYTNATTPDPESGSEPNYLWLEDYVPANISYLSATPTAALALPQMSWSLDSVRPGTSKSFTWWGQIAAGTPGGTIIPNTTDGSTKDGPTISNRVQTLVGSATVSLVKSINQTVFSFGDTVTYCIAWSNTGTAAVAINIWDTLSPVLTYLGSTNGGTLNAGNVVVWNLGSQAANTSGSVCAWGRITAYPMLPWPSRDGSTAVLPWVDPVEWMALSHWRAPLALLDPARRP